MKVRNLLICLVSLAAASSQATPVTVISYAVEDLNHLGGDAQNRAELIVNNTGSNAGRFGATRFDADILGAAAGAPEFTDPAQYTLVSATLTLNEQAGRDGNNGTLSGQVGAYFLDTTENSDWTVANPASVNSGNSTTPGTGWYGNSLARPGNFGGGSTGSNNVDNRSNGAANPLSSFWDGTSWQSHTFVSGVADETVTIDLTLGGASLVEIQSILADWVSGSNAGIGLGGEFGNQAFFQSNNVQAGNSVGSTIDGDATFSGVSSDTGIGEDGPGAGTMFLTLQFEAVPEPGTIALVAVGLVGLLANRRRR